MNKWMEGEMDEWMENMKERRKKKLLFKAHILSRAGAMV